MFHFKNKLWNLNFLLRWIIHSAPLTQSCFSALQCRPPRLYHGRLICSDGNNVGSVCTVRCETENGYTVYPKDFISMLCRPDETWNATACCGCKFAKTLHDPSSFPENQTFDEIFCLEQKHEKCARFLHIINITVSVWKHYLPQMIFINSRYVVFLVFFCFRAEPCTPCKAGIWNSQL